MRVAVVHNEVGADAGSDVRDVLVQAEHVSAALVRRGHESEVVSCSLDLAGLVRRLDAVRPDVVFNLVESLGGHDRLIHVAPSLFDALGLAYTGSAAEAMFVTASKVLTKERLWAAGLPAPPVLALWPESRLLQAPARPPPSYDRVIVKSVWDHGSPEMDDDSVTAVASAAELRELLRAGGSARFAEPYVDGREVNLSMIAGEARGPILLPAAEIVFLGYPEGKPRIVGREAKWRPDSFEYAHTPRRTEFPDRDRPLLEELGRLARSAWKRLGLAGYARIDFRVDATGQPWIVDVNVNPCLSPDAGFAAALASAEISFGQAIETIAKDALTRAGGARLASRPSLVRAVT